MGNGALAIGPKLPRPSSTLPEETFRIEALCVANTKMLQQGESIVLAPPRFIIGLRLYRPIELTQRRLRYMLFCSALHLFRNKA